MAVARVARMTASSASGWQDAFKEGFQRANRTIRGITGLEIVSQKVKVVDGKIAEYRVTMDVTFILDD